MRYQFHIDGRVAGPLRTTWRVAAQDAVSAGYAVWIQNGAAIKLDDTQGATIERMSNIN